MIARSNVTNATSMLQACFKVCQVRAAAAYRSSGLCSCISNDHVQQGQAVTQGRGNAILHLPALIIHVSNQPVTAAVCLAYKQQKYLHTSRSCTVITNEWTIDGQMDHWLGPRIFNHRKETPLLPSAVPFRQQMYIVDTLHLVSRRDGVTRGKTGMIKGVLLADSSRACQPFAGSLW